MRGATFKDIFGVIFYSVCIGDLEANLLNICDQSLVYFNRIDSYKFWTEVWCRYSIGSSY